MNTFFTDEEFSSGDVAQCHKCRLYKKCTSPKMEPVHGRLPILIVGESPNKMADTAGFPLFGPRYEWLEKSLKDRCSIKLVDVHYTNAIICHSDGRPPAEVFEYCRPNLRRTIADVKPRLIITLGWGALTSVLTQETKDFGGPLANWIGWTIPCHRLNAWVCPLENFNDPLFEKSEVNSVIFLNQLSNAIARYENELPKGFSEDELRAVVSVVMDSSEAITRLTELAGQSGVLAFDYETTGLKPESEGHSIVCCSFCLNGRDPWACFITPDMHPLLSAVLRSKNLRKVASNLKFEERWTRQVLGHGVVGWYWDTMLAAHCLDNRGFISSVKFQALIRFGVQLWNKKIESYLQTKSPNALNSVRSAPAKELLIYCAIDAYLEYKVMQDQQCELRRLN